MPSAVLSDAESSALRGALQTYAQIAHASYAEAALGVRALLEATARFLAAPSAAGLEQVRNAWLAARPSYQRSEVFRFYDGPIDKVEMRINTWPIDEGFVERQTGDDKLGIVDDITRYPVLSAALLSELNAKEGETSISTGYHVIEFLLWGADTNEDGPGARSYADYVAKGSESVTKATAGNDGVDRVEGVAARRGQYLRTSIEQLLRDLEQVRDAWEPARADNYRAAFLARTPSVALALAIKGMGSLSGPELAGERLTVAYETKAQENEHSCFSDNTIPDLLDSARGIQIVCSGQHVPALPAGISGGVDVAGPGLCDAIAARDAGLAERLRADIAASVDALSRIPGPFDRAIRGNDAAPGRKAVLVAVRSLETQTATLTRVAASYNLELAALSVHP